MSSQHPADVDEGLTNKRQEDHQFWILSRCMFSMRWTEGKENLPVLAAIVFEHTMEEVKFSWETFLVADSLAGCTKVDSTECSLAGQWWESVFRKRFVKVVFLYTVCPKETSSLLYVSISRKRRWPFDSVSNVNWILGCMLLRWLRKSFSSSGP
jgi:hypothetical protein